MQNKYLPYQKKEKIIIIISTTYKYNIHVGDVVTLPLIATTIGTSLNSQQIKLSMEVTINGTGTINAKFYAAGPAPNWIYCLRVKLAWGGTL